MILFTTVVAALLSAETVCALYRLRWQVEMAFTRLKQLWHLHALRAQTDALCYLVILANLLLALVAEDKAQERGLIDASRPPTPPPTHSPYRLLRSLRDSICQAVGIVAESLAY